MSERIPRTILTDIKPIETDADAQARLEKVIGIESKHQNGQELPIIRVEGFGELEGKTHHCRLENIGYRWIRVLNFLGATYGYFDKTTGIRRVDLKRASGWRIPQDVLPRDMIDREKLIAHILKLIDTKPSSYQEGADYVVSLIEMFCS